MEKPLPRYCQKPLIQKQKLLDMDYVWVLITRLKTSGLTDTMTSVHEVWTNEADALASLERHKMRVSRDLYHGEPELIRKSLNTST